MTWKHNNMSFENSKLQSSLYSMIPILEKSFFMCIEKNRRILPGDGISDWGGVCLSIFVKLFIINFTFLVNVKMKWNILAQLKLPAHPRLSVLTRFLPLRGNLLSDFGDYLRNVSNHMYLLITNKFWWLVTDINDVLFLHIFLYFAFCSHYFWEVTFCLDLPAYGLTSP